jgi:glycosyltransferase involved in cell wall biosynthesis
MRHALSAVREGRGECRVYFSDGEHVGIPLALTMMGARITVPHAVIGHHLITPRKLRLLRRLQPYRRWDRVFVHSANQVERLTDALPHMAPLLRLVPYGVDVDFWSPSNERAEEDPSLVASAGREHRDYETLLAALPEDARLFVADHSAFSPRADRWAPTDWPSEVRRGALAPADLRQLYARAAVVVVPIVPTTFPAGVTTLLEAMAMGKPVIASGTEGLRQYVEDGVTGLIVPPRDALGLRRAISELLADSRLRSALGSAAREAVIARYSLDTYVSELATQLRALSATGATSR